MTLEKEIQKANEMIDTLKREAKTIDDFTFSKENEIHNDVAAKVQTPIQPNKKTGFLKKALVYGLTLFTLGMYSPAVNAENSGVGNNDTKFITKPSGWTGYGPGSPVITSGEGLAGTRDGKLVIIVKT